MQSLLHCRGVRPGAAAAAAAPARRGLGLLPSPRLRHAPRPHATDNGDDAGSGSEEQVCSILNVKVDNAASPQYTKLSIEVQQYPGLFRTVAWTLNGLGVRAHNASMQVADDGYASQTYWLTDLQGNKLSDSRASNVQDSLQDFVETCMPSTAKPEEEWDTGGVFVSNRTHDKYTELLIKGEPDKPGFLLEIATVMAACGANVHQAVIQGDREFAPCCPQVAKHDFTKKGRIFRFLLTEGGGEKLSPGRVSAILYTLDLVAGKGYQPLTLREVQMATSRV